MDLTPWRDTPVDAAERARIVALFPSVWHLETLLAASEAVAELYLRDAMDARDGHRAATRHDGTGSLDRLKAALEQALAAYGDMSLETACRVDRLAFRYAASLPWARETPMLDLRDPDDRTHPLPPVPIKPPLATARLGMMLTDARNFVANVHSPDEPPVTPERRSALRLAGVWRDQTGDEPDERNEPFLQFCRAVLWPAQDEAEVDRSSVGDLIGAADRTPVLEVERWTDAYKQLPAPFDDPSNSYVYFNFPDNNGDWDSLRIVELHSVPFLTYLRKADDRCNVYPAYSAICEEAQGNTRTGYLRVLQRVRYLDEDGWPLQGKAYFRPRNPSHD